MPPMLPYHLASRACPGRSLKRTAAAAAAAASSSCSNAIGTLHVQWNNAQLLFASRPASCGSMQAHCFVLCCGPTAETIIGRLKLRRKSLDPTTTVCWRTVFLLIPSRSYGQRQKRFACDRKFSGPMPLIYLLLRENFHLGTGRERQPVGRRDCYPGIGDLYIRPTSQNLST